MSEPSTEDAANEGLYQSPAVPRPTLTRMRKVADRVGLDLSDEDLQRFTGRVCDILSDYDDLYRMVEPKPPVKYPRTPGYRPPPEENKLNAWYVKTDIPGAQSGKLIGKTVAIKDNICVAGVPMMNGSQLIEGYIPEFDATVVTRTLDAGGRILGKSSCEHFCLSGNSFTNDLGCVLNPFDTSRTTGGSSSGSGALVASGEVDLAIGGDQGGSIRLPAAWCGIVGLKPTHGLIPYTGAVGIEPTLDHLGPMARTVKDCALFLEVLAGPDGFDHRQKYEMAIPEYSQELKDDLNGTKIGLLKEGFERCSEDILTVVKEATKHFVAAGATLSEVSVPQHNSARKVWTAIGMEGGYATVAEKAGAVPGAKGFHPVSLINHQYRAMKMKPNNFSIPLKLSMLFGEYMKEETNFNFYARASNLAMAVTAAYDEALKDVDVLVMPTVTNIAPKLPKKTSDIPSIIKHAMTQNTNTAEFNLTGHPALSINAGFSGGLPVGVMIVGRMWQEQKVMDVAYGFECQRDAKGE